MATDFKCLTQFKYLVIHQMLSKMGKLDDDAELLNVAGAIFSHGWPKAYFMLLYQIKMDKSIYLFHPYP